MVYLNTTSRECPLQRLLSGMGGGSCGVVPGWHPKRLQLGVLQPKLTNACMLVFAFHLPNIVQRGNGRRRPKLCLGLCALSSAYFDFEVCTVFCLKIKT